MRTNTSIRPVELFGFALAETFSGKCRTSPSSTRYTQPFSRTASLVRSTSCIFNPSLSRDETSLERDGKNEARTRQPLVPSVKSRLAGCICFAPRGEQRLIWPLAIRLRIALSGSTPLFFIEAVCLSAGRGSRRSECHCQ